MRNTVNRKKKEKEFPRAQLLRTLGFIEEMIKEHGQTKEVAK